MLQQLSNDLFKPQSQDQEKTNFQSLIANSRTIQKDQETGKPFKPLALLPSTF